MAASSEKTCCPEPFRQMFEENTSLEWLPEKNKVRCKLSGHEMPGKLEAVTSYIKGKKYLRLKKANADHIQKCLVHLDPSNKPNRKYQLFCKLTWRHLNNQPHHIQRHIEGRRFKRALARWEECERTGEPFEVRVGNRLNLEEASDGEEGPSTSAAPEWAAEEDEEDEESDADDMSDLYPADFLKDSDDEEEMDEDETDKKDNSQKDGGKKTTKTATKRKAETEDLHISSKKNKTGKHKKQKKSKKKVAS